MDNYQELIEWLRYAGYDVSRNEAANAIESLLAENERLERNLSTTEQTMREYQELAAKRLEEIEKLRARVAELEERRCEVCGYVEHHREHTGCLRNQVSSLKAELREICAAINDPACDPTLTTVECIKKLKAENESLKRDAERLDFILRKQLIVIQDYDDKYFTYNAQSGKRGPEMDSEAEAIDAAIAKGEKK